MSTVKEYLSRIGYHGGKSTSAAKAAAARRNGKLGGRPKGKKSRSRKSIK